MIAKIYEWLRAADLQPDDQMVTARTKSVQDLETKIRESNDYGLLLGILTASVGGFERLGEQSPVFATLLESVRTQSPAFPSSITENSLHLRIICCLALGELLNSADDETSDWEELLSASLLVSGLRLKPKEAGRHLNVIFEELSKVARANLQKQAVALRERVDLDWKDFDALEKSTDDASFNDNLLPAVKGLLQGLQKQQESDREELEVMWWLYNGYSEHLGQHFKSLRPHLAAAAIGSELADRISPPATTGLTELVIQATVRDRAPAQLKAKPIAKVVVDLGNSGRRLLLPSTEQVRKLVQSRAVLFPLSWLCVRLEESQGVGGWEAELQSRTGLASDHEMTPADLAAQVFAERQAQRVYQMLVTSST